MMIILAVVIGAVIAVAVVPVLILLCADSSDGTPKLNSIKKKQSKKTSDGSTRKQRESNGVEEPTVIANGMAVAPQAQPDVEAAKGNNVTAHAYEDPEILTQTHQAKEINAALTNGSSTSPKSSVVNETSPVSSNRSSRASSGQPRVVSQERALPEIPGPNNNRLSVNTERSPSTKRALPELPHNAPPAPSLPSTASQLEDEATDHYDQLERDLLPHQMRSKTSESASVKSKTAKVVEGGDNDSVDLIEPDEITRTSVFISTDPHEVYSVVKDDEPNTSSEQSKEDLLKPGSVKSKGKAPYTKVKKAGDSKSPMSPSEGASAEPIYTDPPPVPQKLCDVEAELTVSNEEGASAGAVALVIDNNAQDSGSGYYAVTDDGPAPDIAPVVAPGPHIDLPASYDILTGRESIAAVRARQSEEDHYEPVDEVQKRNGSRGASGGAAVGPSVDSGAMEIYAEIDSQEAAPKVADGTKRPAINKPVFKEELYAEIDEPVASTSKPAVAKSSLRPGRPKDYGYEKVDFSGANGDKKTTLAISQNPSTGVNDDEDDYAECDPLPAANVENGGQQVSRHASDVSDYATVNYNNSPAPQPQPQSSAATANGEQRPFQTYKRKEHLYQEIDEVNEEKKPSDKDT